MKNTNTDGRCCHVLWVNQFAATPGDGGGTRHFDLARALQRAGREVTVLAGDFHLHRRAFTRRPSPDDRRMIPETIEGICFGWIWGAPYSRNDWRRLWNWLTFAWGVYRAPVAAPTPTAVIGSSPQLFAALGAWSLARKLRVPFIFEVRDLWPESLEAVSGQRGAFYHLLGLIAHFLYRRANAVIVLAKGSIPVIERAGVARERIWFLPNGVAPEAFPPVERAPRDRLTLIYAGAHGPANGLDVVLEAAALLKDDPRVRFLLVGDGPSKAPLQAQAVALGLANVEFRDPLPKPDLVRLMAEVDGGLMVLKETPLFAYGVSPNKLFDYFGASLPVVCNVPGEVAEMSAEAGAGVQAAGPRASDLASAIRRLADVPAGERAAMGARGRAWVLQERNRERIAAQLDALLNTLP